MTKLKDLAKQMRCGLYVDYGTDLQTAFDAANCYATSTKDPAIFYTALYGVINTLCNVIEEEVNAQSQAEQSQTANQQPETQEAHQPQC